MNILIFNCGSSSLGYKVFQAKLSKTLLEIASGKAHRVGVKSYEKSSIEHYIQDKTELIVTPLDSHRQAALAILNHLRKMRITIDFIGHRIVNGGAIFQESTLVTQKSLKGLEECLQMAPVHNPNSKSIIELCSAELGEIPQYMSFDTAFHASLPAKAYKYALPAKLADQYDFRKYGFHGLSYQSVTNQVADYLDTPLKQLKIIACHLGTGGSSIAAIEGGHSIDTSMGYTPLTGLIMSTRTGDLDPSITLSLMEAGFTADEIKHILNKESGLLGISGYSSDIRDLLKYHDESGNEKSGLAIDMYIHRLKHFIGAYMAILGGLDVLVFTDDVGLQVWQIREMVCAGMEWCGLVLDQKANQLAAPDEIVTLNTPISKVTVLSVPNDEERVIALEGVRLLRKHDLQFGNM